MATIQIDTGEEVDGLVFIDGHYAGKTPLDKSDVAAGQHAITITKEGFETLNRVVNLKKDSVSKYAFALKKLEKKGTISVKTNPEGASVYLGITYLGESPLTNIVVPLGQNRIRIEKEDHVDYYAGFEIEQGKPVTVNAKLKQGKTEDYYKNRLKVFLDYTYFDFSQYSVYSVALFYASFQYWNYRINVHRDTIRGDPWQGGISAGPAARWCTADRVERVGEVARAQALDGVGSDADELAEVGDVGDVSPCGDAVASFPSAGGDAAGAVGDDEDDRADGGGELDEDGLVPSAVDVLADVADVADHDGGGPRDHRSSPWVGGWVAVVRSRLRRSSLGSSSPASSKAARAICMARFGLSRRRAARISAAISSRSPWSPPA